MEDKKKALLELAEAFVRNELVLATYYRLCAKCIPEFKAQWLLLSAQERAHAGAFKRIIKSIQEDPRKWAKGSYLAKTVTMMSEETIRQIEEIKKGTVVKQRIVSFITGVEASLIENDICNSFRTSLPEFTDLLSLMAE